MKKEVTRMIDMVKSLVALPEDKRRAMLRERLNLFADMKDQERQQAMSQMMQAVETLSEADRRTLTKSRLECLCELPEATRGKLMMTHMGIVRAKGQDALMKEMQLVQGVLPELSPNTRTTVETMLKQMM